MSFKVDVYCIFDVFDKRIWINKVCWGRRVRDPIVV